jgi:putative transposase
LQERLGFSERRFSQTGTAFVEPGSPSENPFVESFNSCVRDELLAVEIFSCLAEAKVMVEDFRVDYNRSRPPPSARDADPGRVRRSPAEIHP